MDRGGAALRLALLPHLEGSREEGDRERSLGRNGQRSRRETKCDASEINIGAA